MRRTKNLSGKEEINHFWMFGREKTEKFSGSKGHGRKNFSDGEIWVVQRQREKMQLILKEKKIRC